MSESIAPGLGIETLRSRVREWAESNAPRAWRAQMMRATEEEWKAFNAEIFQRLRRAGLAAPHWPAEFGGGFSFEEQIVIKEELRRADYPLPRFNMIAVGHAAATLIHHGTPEQQRLLEGILDGEIWCQGFSEPDAGSDLASLKTRAERDGDCYVVRGQKIWSSVAQHATWCLLLARTDPTAPKHSGISVFLLRMDTPGITVKPIRQATGTGEFCEVFLDDVRIPTHSLIGAENAGWKVAQTTLATERVIQAVELQAELAQALGIIVHQSRRTEGDWGKMAIDEPIYRRELAFCIAQVDAIGLLARKLIADIVATGEAGPEGSIMKVLYSETLQRVTKLAAQMQGIDALIDPQKDVDISWTSGDWFVDYLKSYTWTISAGSNEIQRNVIGERVLGLPREPVGSAK